MINTTQFDTISNMDNSPVRPIVSFYIFLFTILFLVSALFTHLALVYDIKIFQNLYIDVLFLLPIFIVFILVPKDTKIRIGIFVRPILLSLLVQRSKMSVSQLEQGLAEQEKHRIEQDRKLKSNPIIYALVVSLIVLVLIGFILLNIYILTR